jgi:6-phosphogluconolactonase (cycloisomerase 2 family)
MALNLVNVFNLVDSPFVALAGPTSVTTAQFGNKIFLYVTSTVEGAVCVFEVSASGELAFVSQVLDSDDATLELASAFTVIAADVNGQTFVFVSGGSDNGISSFAALGNGTLLNTDNVTDTGREELLGVQGLASTIFASLGPGGQTVLTTYVFTAGRDDDGISAFRVDNDGSLTEIESVDDTDLTALELLGVSGVATAIIGGTTFVFAAGRSDNGISVFTFDPNSLGTILTNVVNLDDTGNPNFELAGAVSLATAVVGAKTFLFVAGAADDGLSVFEVAANGALTNVDNVTDDATLRLDNVVEVATAKIAGTTYLFAAGSVDNGVSVFAVAADGSLINVDNVSDADAVDLELEGATGIAVRQVGNSTFLFVPGGDDSGVSVFRIDVTGNVINGTAGNDAIDALTAPAGQLLPGDLGDTITGGLGADTMAGGLGADLFNYDAVAESKKGAARDVIEDFTRGEDRIDLATIDAKTGAGNQAFKFIGKQGFHGVKGELHFVKKAGFIIVEGDTNGNGKADFQIQVDDVAKLAAADFVL